MNSQRIHIRLIPNILLHISESLAEHKAGARRYLASEVRTPRTSMLYALRS